MMKKVIKMEEIMSFECFEIGTAEVEISAVVCSNYVRNAVKELRADGNLPKVVEVMKKVKKTGFAGKDGRALLQRYQLRTADADVFLRAI